MQAKMKPLEQFLSLRLLDRETEGTLRTLKTPGNKIDFFSNDYLGLATSGFQVRSVVPTGSGDRFSGSSGSRLLSGNSAFAGQLEKRIALFHQADAALLFNSGYDANLGLASCLPADESLILYDERCHASIIDGIRLNKCTRKFRFAHNSLPDLEEKIRRFAVDGPVLVFVESVYSMDGDFAPLVEMVRICEESNAHLVVDEAHATGIFGPLGAGLVSALDLQHRVFARVHTYGKAMGCHGAAIAGSQLLIQYLVNFARPFIYTTALPGHCLQSINEAYNFLESPAFNSGLLHELIAYFRNKVSESGITGWTDSKSPIQALVAGDIHKCQVLASRLQQEGLQVNPIFSPTVPDGEERLRICLHTFNTPEQVDRIFEVLAAVG